MPWDPTVVGVMLAFGSLAVAILLWITPDLVLFLAGLAMLPLGVGLFLLGPAIFHEIAGIELIVGGLTLVGLAAIIRELRTRGSADAKVGKNPTT